MPVYAASTELDAVNEILTSVGQAAVTTLDLRNPEVSVVLTTLREQNKIVQAQGWTFNTERHYKLQPDATTKEIAYPTNALALDANRDDHHSDMDLIRRNSKLYDRYNHTFQFSSDISADVTWYYITSRAARVCCIKMVGDATLNQLLEEQETNAKSAALEYESQQGDYTMFGFKDGQDYYNSYQPFTALIR
jgi:hypothetical protein